LTIRAQRKFGIELTSTDNLTNLQIIRKNQPVKRKEERYSVFQQQNNQYNQFNQMNIFNTRASHYGDNLPTPSLANTHQNEYEMGYSAQGMTEGVNNFLEFVDETKKYRIE